MTNFEKSYWILRDKTFEQIDETNRFACKAIQELSFTTSYANIRIENAIQIAGRFLELNGYQSGNEQGEVLDILSKGYLSNIESLLEDLSDSYKIFVKLNPLNQIFRYVADDVIGFLEDFFGLFIAMKGE